MHRRCNDCRGVVVIWLVCTQCASGEPARCRKLAPDNSSSTVTSGLGVGERYVDIVHCGSVSLLISRLQANLHEFEWVTLARPFDGARAGRATPLIPSEWHMSHNAATVCVNDTLHVFGGQYRNYTGGRGATARGVFHSSASARLRPGEPFEWSSPTLQLQGFHKGCIERRPKFAGYCEFDGLFSSVFFKGRFFIYGRANLSPLNGARHVQMTSAPADLSNWSPFQVISLPGVKAGRSDANIYFFHVQLWGDRLLALFPAVFSAPDSAGIYATTSIDGIVWTRPERLMRVPAACARTRVHPVRVLSDAYGDQLVVLKNIDLSEPGDIPAGRTHAKGATHPYLQKIRIHVDRHELLGIDQFTQMISFRVATTAWHDLIVDG